MDGWVIRDRRRAAGLTLGQVARAAGTSEPNVSAYERGTKRAAPATLERILVAIAAGSDSVVHRHGLSTVPSLAAAIRRGLKEGWTTADLLRQVRQLIQNTREVQTPSDWELILARPSTTGDQRWDTAIAGVADLIAMEAALPSPKWAQGVRLVRPWWVGEPNAMRANAFARSPFPLWLRGVMLDPDDLVAV